jgi:glycosyltransferase involved in cell wall biosynthesis
MTGQRVLACAFACTPPGMPGFTGGEHVLGWNLIQQIARFREVWVLANQEDKPGIEQGLIAQPMDGVHFQYVGLPSWLRPLLKFQGAHQLYYYIWQLQAYMAARRLHRQLRFDLFHHITYANDWMTSFTGAFLPIPYIRGPGGGAHRTPKGLQNEYTLGGRIWENIRASGQWMFRRDPIFRRGQSRAHSILVCNRDSLGAIPDKWTDKASLFPVSGISDEDLLLIPTAKSNPAGFNVLTAGSLIRVKGFALAIKAFKRFSESHPDALFNIVGSGPEESRLRALIVQTGMQDKVKLVGNMPRDLLLTEMAGCDVFLFPSLRDGGGTVVVEAMAVGRPVVCLDIGGPGMHITDGCGISITPSSQVETVRRLAEALERLYSNGELRSQLGNAGRERARKYYHWSKLGDRLDEIYRQSLGEGRVD